MTETMPGLMDKQRKTQMEELWEAESASFGMD